MTSPRPRGRGATLVEVLIYASLMTVVFGAIYGIFLAGRRYFEIARASIEVQQAANTIGYRLTRELMESDLATVDYFPRTGAASAPPGVVFMSARGPATGGAGAGLYEFDSTYGVPRWQKFVAYYLDEDPSYPGHPEMRALYVAELSDPAIFPRTAPARASALGLSTATFQSRGESRRLLAHGVRAPSAARPQGGFQVYSVVGGAPTTTAVASPVHLDLELVNTTAGVARGAGGSNENSLTTRLRIEPRG